MAKLTFKKSINGLTRILRGYELSSSDSKRNLAFRQNKLSFNRILSSEKLVILKTKDSKELIEGSYAVDKET